MNDLKESNQTLRQAMDQLKEQQEQLKTMIDFLNEEKLRWVKEKKTDENSFSIGFRFRLNNRISMNWMKNFEIYRIFWLNEKKKKSSQLSICLLKASLQERLDGFSNVDSAPSITLPDLSRFVTVDQLENALRSIENKLNQMRSSSSEESSAVVVHSVDRQSQTVNVKFEFLINQLTSVT